MPTSLNGRLGFTVPLPSGEAGSRAMMGRAAHGPEPGLWCERRWPRAQGGVGEGRHISVTNATHAVFACGSEGRELAISFMRLNSSCRWDWLLPGGSRGGSVSWPFRASRSAHGLAQAPSSILTGSPVAPLLPSCHLLPRL